MTRFFLLFFLFLFFFNDSFAQTGQDSAAIRKDSVAPQVPSVAKDTLRDSVGTVHAVHKLSSPRIKKDSSLLLHKDSSAAVLVLPIAPVAEVTQGSISYKRILSENPYYNFSGKPELQTGQVHQARSFDLLFYLLLAILFYFALVKLLFGKYMGHLFTLFFRISMRQQQIREQVLQSPLPSLLLNLLFIVSAGLYASFLVRYAHFAKNAGFWMLYMDCALLLTLVYLGKFLILKLSGWMFNITRATDTYIFIIFLANKILGIFLLPFLVILSFSGPLMQEIAVTLSVVMIFSFLAYRFVVAYNPVRKEINVSGFHFFLYLCAFEVAPLLLIYKVLLNYLEKGN